MARSKYAAILALFMCAGLVAACAADGSSSNSSTPAGSASNPNTENFNAIHTNPEELGVLIKVPFDTEDIVWKEYPTQKRILAVIRFSTANANRIAPDTGGTPEDAEVAVESWFPDELIAQSEMSGDRALRGTAFPATAFYQEPYTTGKAIRVAGTDYFVVDLAAK